ncbi:MAG: YfiR family protein [Candidatus Thiodiazotropha lotti]|uniref:YfiR family protein n=1 Tax=Candidatus Thiodiazotropha endoloripes TaxID=1818881 RepID=A0A1E2US48_9GAMM|nr:hypothetical protein [Candidatus Thiodiazotropha endoloripes]MCG7897903.1 YfiR family protein [Candidatus Thiodiazotropha weberae]MCG7990339.1 YfiR family protein [Candidatus Thiodiazotropha lotti]MCG7999024.1 YfiR family protein [Candidatus Thiodiazotropha lotti]MCW4181993.1 YfiR family protein [Candidatus Thiodiazotropha weberae]MCW4190792.1 YfiR family protein [Candidatus Thiodiazotropha weberae]
METKTTSSEKIHSLWRGFLLLILLLSRICFADILWSEDKQRLNVAINLLPACLGADLALADKLSVTGKLRILVLHDNQQHVAMAVSAGLLALKTISDFPLEVEIVSTSDRKKPDLSPIAALFVATPGIKSEIFNNWVENKRTTVFSPFSGDVERGAVAGIYVTDRILPYINLTQAKKAGVVYKPFFLRIAKQYDE